MRSTVKTGLALLIAAAALLAGAPSRGQDESAPAAVEAAPHAPAALTDSSEAPVHHPATAAKSETSKSEAPKPPEQAGVTPLSPAILEAFVDGVAAEAMRRDHVAGAAVSVVQNGQVILDKGYGFSSPHHAVDPDRTLFRLGGVTSTFTWIALAKEAEAGRIRLDAPLNLFLPEALRIPDQGFHRDIAVRDLMTHSAGFEDRTLGQLFEDDPANVRALPVYLREERPRRVREPGQLPSASPYGAALAGAALAYVNLHPYDDIVEGELLRPLGLSHTTLREPYPARSDLPAPIAANLSGDFATGYRWRSGDFEPQPFEYATQVAPAEGASSSAGDMARYMRLILDGGQLDGVTVYSPATAQGFRTTTLAGAPGVNGWDNGFMEFSLPGGYRGQGQLGDTLWFHASLVTVPALNLGVFVATNTDTGARLATDLPGQIVARFYAQPQIDPRPGAQALADDADAYAGDYLTTRRPYGGLGKFVFMLSHQLRVKVTPDGRLVTQGAGQTRAWTLADGATDHLTAVDGPQTSAFAMADGQAVRWFAPNGQAAFDRIGLLYRIPVLAGAAALAALASILVLAGVFTRDRRESRQTAAQGRAGLLQSTIAVLWLIVLPTFAVWSFRAQDPARLMYHWPGVLLLVASTCAFVAAILTLLTLLMAPIVWRGGRRLDSWNGWRKFSFTCTTLVFTGFSVVLGLWGALEPWSR